MSLVDRLRRVGARLGLVRVVDLPQPTAAHTTGTRTVTLHALATEIRGQEVQALAQLPAEMSVEFAKVFEAAGIAPPVNGWNMDALQKVLRADPFKTMDRAAVRKALLERLAADKVPVEDLARDALARNKALDAFAAFVRQKMSDRARIRRERVADLESQIQVLQQQAQATHHDLEADQESWRQWQDRKTACAKEMAWAIAYLVDQPVVTIAPPESV